MKLSMSKPFALRQIGCSVLLLAISLIMLIGMLSDLSAVQTPKEWFLLVCAFLALPLFGTLIVLSVRKVGDSRPFIEVDDKGISTTYRGYGIFKWSDILSVGMVEIQASLTSKVQFLVIVPKNPGQLISRLDAKTQKGANNAMKQWGGLGIPLMGLGFKAHEIAGSISEYSSQMVLANAAPPPVLH